jgi:hypothetical protein
MITRMGSTDGDHGTLFAAAYGDATVAGHENAVGPAGCDGHLSENACQVRIAVPGGGALRLAGRGLDTQRETSPTNTGT